MTCEHVTDNLDTCDSCSAELGINPFRALRVAYGMLLGEDDFRVLMGSPRGKQMLHSAWLHRSGVVWGFDVCVDGTRMLKVSPGLAVDGLGRELAQEVSWCANVQDWVAENAPASSDKGCQTRTLCACLTVEFDCCLTEPVPTLADPCDVTRKHDDFSRIVETSKLMLREGHCPCRGEPFHRTRVLLGIDEVGDDDCAGEEALRARGCVASKPPAERAEELLLQFRRMTALDVAEIRPAKQPGTDELTLFPVLEVCAPVTLACVEIDVRDRDGCVEIEYVRVDSACRTVLLPTATIQELLCGLSPSLIGADAEVDAGGPRVIADSVVWSEDDSVCTFEVTKELNPGSVKRAIRITSLSQKGWVQEDINTVRYCAGETTVVIELADAPANDLVRLIVKGTGPMPMFGCDPAVPLAGLECGPPGTADDGHDAVLTVQKPLPDGTEADQ